MATALPHLPAFAFCAGLLLAVPAGADDGWGGLLGASSDYAWRGLSLSDNRPTAQADLHYHGESDWFAGVGLASASAGTGADSYSVAEFDAYLGQGWALGEDWGASLSLGHYGYAGGDDPGLYRYDQLALDLNYRHRVYLSAAASPDTRTLRYQSYVWYSGGQPWVDTYISGSHSGPAYAYELVLAQPLPWYHLSANAGLGYRDLKNLQDLDYVYGSAGLAWTHGPWEVDLSDIRSSHNASLACCGSPPVNRWVGSALWHF